MAKWWKRRLPPQAPTAPVSTDGAEAKALSEIALQAAKEQHAAVSEVSRQFEFYNERNHYIARVKKAWGDTSV